MNRIENLSRRGVLAGSAAAAGGLLLGFRLPGGAFAEDAASAALNAFVRLAPDGTTTVMLSRSEMGQGIYTSVAMTVAEELEADWRRIRVEGVTEPHRPDYWTPGYAGMGTGGSRSIRECWPILRRAAAAAREMLTEAAAARWSVPVADCRAENGEIVHTASGRRLAYGALAEAAAALTPPAQPVLKPRRQWRLMGKPMPQLDIPAKVTGQAVYGIDVQVPELLTAAVAQSPVHGGTVAAVTESDLPPIKALHSVMQAESFVAVLAQDYWSAKRGLEALSIAWREPDWVDRDTAAVERRLRDGLEGPAEVALSEGDVDAGLSGAARVLEADYEVPYLAHTCMEPINCTAQVLPDRCVLWGPFQTQGWAQGVAAKLTGLPPEQVTVHTTFLGGGFGRKFLADFVAQAVLIALSVPGRPVKMIWSREEDIGQGHFRPAARHRLRVGLDGDGTPIAWAHRLAQPSILERWLPDRSADLTQLERIAAESWPQAMLEVRAASMTGVDPTSAMGFRSKAFYEIANRRLEVASVRSRVPVSIWRSVGNSGDAFVLESMVDELATAARQDPYLFRRRLLAKAPRALAVLDRAAEAAGWNRARPSGQHLGIAIDQSFGAICAQVAEVSVAAEGGLRVHRMVAVLDCGVVVNPGAVRAQIEGSVIQGLSAALHERVTIEDGRVVETNFDRYRILSLAEAPVVEAHVMDSEEAPGSAGEPALPPVAPAVANAIFAATGKRLRSLPIAGHDLRPA